MAVRQILTNLISNALKASPENGRVQVSTRLARGALEICVSDKGGGMTSEEIKRALTPFGQVDDAFDSVRQGTGLGLTIVKALVEAHGGQLDIASRKNVGTSAKIHFPAQAVSKDGSLRHTAA